MSPKTLSILVGAAVVAVLSSSYLTLINCLCCAGVVAGAMVAVAHYTSTQRVTVTSGQGAGMGAIAAVLGAVLAFIIDIPLSWIGIGSAQVFMSIVAAFQDMMPPDQAALLADQMEAQQTFAARLVNAVIGLVISGIFGAVGGALGAALFQKGQPPPGPESAEPPPAAPITT